MAEPTPEQQVSAVVTIARSTVARWIIVSFLLPGIGWCAGWVIAKVDTSRDLAKLNENVQALTKEQSELIKRVDAQGSATQQRLNGVQRDVVVATGAAIAYETTARAASKLHAGEELAKSYDGRLATKSASDAAADVIHNVAVPHGR